MFVLAAAEVARANHTHVLILPNGNCAILAASGNEKYTILPDVLFTNNPNVDADDAAGALETPAPERLGTPGVHDEGPPVTGLRAFWWGGRR